MSHNALTDRYLAAFAGSGLSVPEFLASVQPAIAGTHFGGQCLSRPGFLQRSQVSRLEADLQTLYSCVTSLPNRLFGGDLAAFAIATGTAREQVETIVRGRGSAPSRLARADLYADETGFRVMELNMSAALGGLDNAVLNRAMLRQPFLAEFAAQNQLGYLDTFVEVAETLLAECKVPSGGRPVVALTDWPASYPDLAEQLHKNAAALAELGIDALPCHLGQLRLEADRVWLGERQVDVIYRLFLMEDLLDEAGPALIDPVLRAAERGTVQIFSPMDAELYGSKGALALLSDEANRHLFSEPELSCLDRFLPWTRMVRSEPVTVAGSVVQLDSYAISERIELILKPTLLHGGAGVVAGWQTEPAEWRDRLAEAMDGHFVLQKRIHPYTEPFPGEGGTEQWLLVWGAFLGARGYSGMYLRGSAEVDRAVLNMATGAIASCCFHEL